MLNNIDENYTLRTNTPALKILILAGSIYLITLLSLLLTRLVLLRRRSRQLIWRKTGLGNIPKMLVKGT